MTRPAILTIDQACAGNQRRRLTAATIFSILLGTIGLLTASSADAQTPQPPAAKPEKLIIGVQNIDYAPISTAENGVYGGLARAIFDAFAADCGYTLEYRPLPIPRLYATLFAGELDFKFPDNPNWEADKRVGKNLIYSKRVIDYIDGTLVRPENLGRPVDTVKVVGSVTGFAPFVWLDRIRGGQTRLTENANLSALLQQVIAKRIDGAYANVAIVRHRLTTELKQPGALVFDPKLPHAVDGYRMSTIKHADILATFDLWLDQNTETIARMKIERGMIDDLPQQAAK